jgi:uncharacterized small protein (DUF1192 family)
VDGRKSQAYCRRRSTATWRKRAYDATSYILIISLSLLILPLSPHINSSLYMDNLAAMDEKIMLMESEILRVQAELIKTKKKRNTFAPIFRLPHELLVRILFHTQVSLSTTENVFCHPSLHKFSFDADWEKAMIICTRVYHVSISSPELWAQVKYRKIHIACRSCQPHYAMGCISR